MIKNLRVPISWKMIASFFAVSLIPLALLGYFGNKNLQELGNRAIQSVDEMGDHDLKSARAIGERAIEDTVKALNLRSTEAIELRTIELANRIAGFLYGRDKDILLLASFQPDPQVYLKAYSLWDKKVVQPRDPSEGDPWQETVQGSIQSSNSENKGSWRHRPPDRFKRISQPMYKEITFVDVSGIEHIKIADGRVSNDLKDVSNRKNTFCKAEDYFSHLAKLGPGEIYVSRVIGAYVPGWLEHTAEGVKVKPESAYAGQENPRGCKFDGIIRWVTPIFQNEQKIGYLTMALDHTHIREFLDHVVPTEERFAEMSDAGSGNYAFLWDVNDRCVSHPRHFFICGFDPETGLPVPGWLSQDTYNDYKQSGRSLEEFVAALPSFREFTQRKKAAKEQIAEGRIPLDCRVLDTAPQCEGWHRGTEDGGSGSFVILWSGLWKFTSYAAVPYFTGEYGKSRRGFGYVTVGANVPDFHKAANVTKDYIEQSMQEKSREIQGSREKTRLAIKESDRRNRNVLSILAILSGCCVFGVAVFVSLNITRPIKDLTKGAAAIARGHFPQRIEVNSRDELKQLAESFNEMAAAVAELDRMKSDFVTTASHELRTPIHSMLLVISGTLAGYSGPINEELREDLETVRGELSRLTRLVNDLLDLSRIEARKAHVTLSGVSAKEVIDAAVSEVTGLADDRSHVIRMVLAPDLPRIQADRDRMIQVLVNLLSNSIKYSPDGATIIITAHTEADALQITVVDNGYGVPAWAHQKIFDKFFQADSIMSQKVGGSGLGLTISAEILNLHHGAIDCKSPLSPEDFPDLPLGGERKGSVFTVTLPLSSPITEV